ncbi:MAG: beta-propeller domain-containing protein [Eubacteriales bacterium]|nr:beta-propeller domain-containing protein [Eubacteriales bacterium]
MKKLLWSFLSIVLCLGLVLGIGGAGSSLPPGQNSGANDGSLSANIEDAREPEIKKESLAMAGSYTDVYAAILAFSEENGYRGTGTTGTDMVWDSEMSEEAIVESEPEMPSEAPSEDMSSVNGSSKPGTDHSETNTQVSGIDEGDIVKTDGEYIYILRNEEFLICKADGEATAVISRTSVGRGYEEKGIIYGEKGGYESHSKYPQELFISGDLAIILSSVWDYREYEENGRWHWENDEYVEMDIYDVSDPTAPTFRTSLGQDGSMTASRMMDGRVYVVSRYYIYEEMDEEMPQTYVPCLYRDGVAEPVAADCIYLPGAVSSASYAVVAVYDPESGTVLEKVSTLGGAETVYMGHDSLYLTGRSNGAAQSDPYTESVYTVVDHHYYSETTILRFDITEGLTLVASGTVPGYLHNQFSLDEYEGFLRIVTTEDHSYYTTYTDEERGWVNYSWDDSATTNSLYVLDEDMNIKGSITGLAAEERVYSVRFDGEIGYFVTFRQVDPLFAVDLSDPTSPKVLSALKIPGFSEYLHPWSEGRLFGLGMNADAETGFTDGMKLSMFDTGDPANVKELCTLALDTGYSAALDNHKAILVSPARNLIGFPADEGYDVYSYTDGEGFQILAHIDCGWSWNARGLYIGNLLYIVGTDMLTVLDMENFVPLTTISLAA